MDGDTTPAAVETTPTATDDIVEQWFQEVFHNQALETQFYNRAFDAKATLKARLNAALTQ